MEKTEEQKERARKASRESNARKRAAPDYVKPEKPMEKPTQQELRRLFDYDEETGLLTRRIKTGPNTRAGDTVGCPHQSHGKPAYLSIRIGPTPGRLFKVHQIIWAWKTGEWPTQIDHVDLDGFNNRWKNLRTATRSQNRMNMEPQANNTSGFKNVFWHKQKQCFDVIVVEDGKRYCSGGFETAEEADMEACRLRLQHHREFARHK